MRPLQIIKIVAITKARHKYALVKCFCGNVFYALVPGINTGNTKSCGCLSGSTKAVFSLTTGHADKTYWHWLGENKPKDL